VLDSLTDIWLLLYKVKKRKVLDENTTLGSFNNNVVYMLAGFCYGPSDRANFVGMANSRGKFYDSKELQ
jgi:hypothetical protein